MRLELLAQQVAAIGSPSGGLTLDVGHAYLAIAFCQTDVLSSVASAVPYVRHVNRHDNYGRLDWTSEEQSFRLPNGEGDLHLPPGWGTIPPETTAKLLTDYAGWLTLEIRPCYRAHYAQALIDTQALVEEAAV
jgi:sugar phosphate isomerase/epimerase